MERHKQSAKDAGRLRVSKPSGCKRTCPSIRTRLNLVQIRKALRYALVRRPVREFELLLDVGIHVFNSGTVSFEGTKVYANNEYFHHGRYIYLRVPRGKFAKVWAEVKDRDGNKTVVARLLYTGRALC